MKQTNLFFYIVFLLFSQCLVITSAEQAEVPNGIDLYIKACQNRRENPALFNSIFLEFEMTQPIITKTPEEIDKEVKLTEDHIKKYLKDNPNINRYLKGTKESLEAHYKRSSEPSLYTVRYSRPNLERYLLSIDIMKNDPRLNKLNRETAIISDCNFENGKNDDNVVCVGWFPRMQEVVIDKTPSELDSFLNMGRLRGDAVPFVLQLLWQNAPKNATSFPDANIALFKQKIENQRKDSKYKIFENKGVAQYDEGKSNAFIIESSIDNIVLERYWIDDSRGYICPLVQYYDTNKQLIAEYKADNYFKDEKTGIWYPQKYSEIRIDPKNKTRQEKIYKINQNSFRVNYNPAMKEFSLNIPVHTKVIDNRQPDNAITYRTLSEGVLSLDKEGLAIQNMPWLENEGVMNKDNKHSLFSITLTCTGIVFLLFMLFQIKRHYSPIKNHFE